MFAQNLRGAQKLRAVCAITRNPAVFQMHDLAAIPLHQWAIVSEMNGIRADAARFTGVFGGWHSLCRAGINGLF